MAKMYEITESQRTEIEEVRKKNRNKNIERKLRALVLRAEKKGLKEISELTGYHYVTVSNIISQYVNNGIGAIIENHYRGNRRNMSFEEEAAILEPFMARAEKGEMIDIKEIATAYQKSVTHKISNAQIYRVLKRHGWRKVMPRSQHPGKASDEAIEASKRLKQP